MHRLHPSGLISESRCKAVVMLFCDWLTVKIIVTNIFFRHVGIVHAHRADS